MLIIGKHLCGRKNSRRYGVIECDPLVRQGLDRTVSQLLNLLSSLLDLFALLPFSLEFALEVNVIYFTGKAHGHPLHANDYSSCKLDWV